jgi:hypothetical protein
MKQRSPCWFVHVVQLRDEAERCVGEDGFIARPHRACDFNGHYDPFQHRMPQNNGFLKQIWFDERLA